MDISISSSNFVKRKEFEALCSVVDNNAKMLNGVKAITDIHAEQLRAIGQLVDLRQRIFDSELERVSSTLINAIPQKYQHDVAIKVMRIIRQENKEYEVEATVILDRLKEKIANIERSEEE
jgi:hypothetical protein